MSRKDYLGGHWLSATRRLRLTASTNNIEIVDENDVVVSTSNNTNPKDIVYPLGGQYLLDPNEINGWGLIGPTDNTNNQDLGNADGTTLSGLSGGLCYPYDVKIKRLYAWHRNNNAAAQAWGWILAAQTKQPAATTTTTTFIINEPAQNGGAAPRDYGDVNTQLTDLDLTAVPEAQLIPAGTVIVLGVSAPTAQTANRYVQIASGYIHLERI